MGKTFLESTCRVSPESRGVGWGGGGGGGEGGLPDEYDEDDRQNC